MTEHGAAQLLRTLHAEKLVLCEALERIADSLPYKVDRHLCVKTASTLVPALTRAHQLEEDWLFPKLQAIELRQIDRSTTLARLRDEHVSDAGFAEEIVEALMSCGGEMPADSETIGYMLRGFFEALRRHVAFEAVLLSLLMEAEENEARHSRPAGPLH